MTADHKGQVFKYDYHNRIVEAQSSTNKVEFAYDAYGRRISKKVYERDGQLRLCNISPKIYEIFKITRLTKIFDIYSDVESAAESLSEVD